MKTSVLVKIDTIINTHNSEELKSSFINIKNHYLCLKRIIEEKKKKGISAFIVDTKTPGFKISKKERKLGIRGSSCVQIVLDQVEVPAENMLHSEGDEGRRGLRQQVHQGRFTRCTPYR